MNQVILKLSGLPGNPEVRVDLEDGAVLGLDEVLPRLEPRPALRVCQALATAGEALEQEAKFAAACSVYAAAARVANAAGSILNQSICLNNLALANKRQGKKEEAIKNYEEAIRLLERPLTEPAYEEMRLVQLANSLCNLAILYHECGDQVKVRHYALWARRIVTGRTEEPALRVAEECRKLIG